MVLVTPSSSFVKTFGVILCLFLSHNVTAVTIHRNKTTPAAVFTFGDSILDTGNNDYISTNSRSNFPPYGRDFMGGKPTGRFSNERLPSDLLAEGVGVKKILPPYLDPNLQLQDILTGVCFASAGSGYDPLTSQPQSVLPLSDQLKLFKEYKSKITAAVGKERTATLLSESLFVLSSGSNDLSVNYFLLPLRMVHYDIPAFTDLMLISASNFLQGLHALGPRVIGVLSMAPIGCVPGQRILHGGIKRVCYKTENQAAMLFNLKLSRLVNSLNERLPEAQFIYIDIYNPLLSMLQHPAKYEFEVADRGCCGTGPITSLLPVCARDTTDNCNDASKYISWDGYHPTETAYKMLTSVVLKQANKFI